MSQKVTEWRTIPGYPRYRISEFGEVEDLKAGKMLAVTSATRGAYPKVCLRDHIGNSVYGYLHRLVAFTFLGPPPVPDALVMHLDHNAQNNHHTNLKWGTHKTNAAGRLERGTVLRGAQLHNAVLTETQVTKIRHEYAGGATTTELAENYGISRQNVNNIVRHRSWREVGGPPAPAHRRKRQGEKLDERSVRDLRKAFSDGVSKAELARRFNITEQAVYMIVTRRRWGKVE
ncbi:HNH endonuclease [Paracraurococcus lichenis]|uniref:HNH endonuclease n=1 Tax=Paracraurococcus lichenis TaxID=3064888 RepID=A0ABT9EBN2_9PROT|nr:HNH endonuclease [Paracraurococcus sp. LOR1-02]MDO9713450.1 HNH endonuclease [Paracraurococcus sp. LOR1-02]